MEPQSETSESVMHESQVQLGSGVVSLCATPGTPASEMLGVRVIGFASAAPVGVAVMRLQGNALSLNFSYVCPAPIWVS